MPSVTTSPLSLQPASKQPPKSPSAVLAEAEAQWIFTETELAETPSIIDGMSTEQERELRMKGLNFILSVGIMLKLPQLTLSTAGVFFHRFLMRHSMQKTEENPKPLHHYQIAATSLFLTTKTSETTRRLKDLIIACCRVAQKNPNLLVDEQSKDYWRWRDTLLFNEDVFLEALCFDLSVESPHKLLFDMMKTLKVERNKKLRNAAWAFLNDSGLTMACLVFRAGVIAAAGLWCGARFSDTLLPGDPGFEAEKDSAAADEEAQDSWWKILNVRLADVKKACNFMVEVYEKPNSGLKVQDPAIYTGLRTPVENDEEDGELIGEENEQRNANGEKSLNVPVREVDGDDALGATPRGIKRSREDLDKEGEGDGSEEGELEG